MRRRHAAMRRALVVRSRRAAACRWRKSTRAPTHGARSEPWTNCSDRRSWPPSLFAQASRRPPRRRGVATERAADELSGSGPFVETIFDPLTIEVVASENLVHRYDAGERYETNEQLTPRRAGSNSRVPEAFG